MNKVDLAIMWLRMPVSFAWAQSGLWIGNCLINLKSGGCVPIKIPIAIAIASPDCFQVYLPCKNGGVMGVTAPTSEDIIFIVHPEQICTNIYYKSRKDDHYIDAYTTLLHI